MDNNKSNVDVWQPIANRYVAYIDIMGFKNLIATSSPKEIYDMMKKIDENVKMLDTVSWGVGNLNMIRTTKYSDSIIIYSKDDSYNSLRSILFTVSSFSSILFTELIPHRGALAFGSMTLDTENSIFFGQPLIDASLLEQELNFYGIIVHGSAEQKIQENSNLSIDFILNYKCALKNGFADHLTICPAFLKLSGTGADAYKERREALFSSLQKFRFKTSGYLRKYLDNTEMYFKDIAAIK